MVTSAVGLVLSATVKVTVPPFSVVLGPEGAETARPGAAASEAASPPESFASGPASTLPEEELELDELELDEAPDELELDEAPDELELEDAAASPPELELVEPVSVASSPHAMRAKTHDVTAPPTRTKRFIGSPPNSGARDKPANRGARASERVAGPRTVVKPKNRTDTDTPRRPAA